MEREPYFNFGNISKVNYQRCISPEGFDYNPENTKEFNLYMLACLTEELGEVAGAFKKIYRGFNARELKKMQDRWMKANRDASVMSMPTQQEFQAMWLDDKMRKVKTESADLFTYLDLFLTRNGIDIQRETINKFNQVSKEMNCEQFKL